MTRGFVTIATGKDRYFKLARNLLASYRLFAKGPGAAPFAIICDRENDVTACFDDVIILDDAACSYMDKVRLPELSPYDETIFVDADCLAYRDLNDWWGLFADATDFSCFGYVKPADAQDGWFRKEDVGEYSSRVDYCLEFQGGVYFMRKGEALDRFYETAKHVHEHYGEYRFRFFVNPADETIFSLAMVVNGMRPVENHREALCWFPMVSSYHTDIEHGSLSYTDKAEVPQVRYENCYLIHFGTPATREPMYNREGYKARRLSEGKALVDRNVRLVTALSFTSFAVSNAPQFILRPGHAFKMLALYIRRYVVIPERS